MTPVTFKHSHFPKSQGPQKMLVLKISSSGSQHAAVDRQGLEHMFPTKGRLWD